ncbi:MAG: ribonuclease PH [Acidobacteriia bacterium]|jgi:ribonuclease PH|nr:ribonuclease PH [Terriglobia bacterium]
MREDGRKANELREVKIEPNFIVGAEGSVLISLGDTRVICTASVEDSVPSFLRGKNTGWITSEYSMIPRATNTRTTRESSRGKVSGRTQEIQRLIGRSLRSIVRMEEMGERTIWMDCDVIQADGGTRTASITGAFVALTIALQKLVEEGLIVKLPIKDFVAATSVGLVRGLPLLDLNYGEDSQAQVDMNVIQTGDGSLIEIQGTAEGDPFARDKLNSLLDLAESGIKQLIEIQRNILQI